MELWKLFADGIPTYMKEILIFIVADCFVFCSFSVYFTEVEKTNVSENSCWNCIHLYRTGAISHRSKYRIYAGWKLSGTTNCGASLSLDYYPDWHDYGDILLLRQNRRYMY